MKALKALDIVERVKQESPGLFGSMPDKKAAKLVKEILSQVAQHVESAEEGKISVAGLGTFRVRQMERDKDGETVSLKKIGFKLAKIKAGGGAEHEPEEAASEEDDDFEEE